MKIRLQRFMADCGVASRRACEDMILQGRVRVNGEIRTQAPVLVDPAEDVITVDENVVASKTPGQKKAVAELTEQARVYFLLNKPKGILVTNYDPSDRKTVGELMTGVKERVFPVGRLDMDARGALIMTNDGELANRLSHPRYALEKTYIVEVEGQMGPSDFEKMKKGLWLGPDRPAAVHKGTESQSGRGGKETGGGNEGFKSERFKMKVIGRERGRTILEVKISEGKNREVRRVMARLGHPVRDLNRVAIAGKITTKGLEPGEFRPLKPDELKWLMYASSPDYQERERAATQAWFEAKEMQKERKRIATEEEEKAASDQKKKSLAATSRIAGVKNAIPSRPPREDRRPPVRKGRKPFVPPSGRNAGALLGGSKKNRLAMMRALREKEAPPAEAANQTIRPAHPLGDKAKRDTD